MWVHRYPSIFIFAFGLVYEPTNKPAASATFYIHDFSLDFPFHFRRPFLPDDHPFKTNCGQVPSSLSKIHFKVDDYKEE